MGFAGRVSMAACLALTLASAADAYGDVYTLVQYGAAEDEDLAFGEGAQMAGAALSPPGVGVSASAVSAAPGPGPIGSLGGAVQLDVAAATPFAFDRLDRAGGAAEAFLSDVWLPVLPGPAGQTVSLTLRVHAAGSGETRGNPDVRGALGSNVLVEAGVFEAFGSGFAGAVTAEAQLGYQVLPPAAGVPPGFVPPFFTGAWAGGGDWTVTTDAPANLQTFSWESDLEIAFQWSSGTAFEVALFTQYFAGWCCRNVDEVLDAPIHASLSHDVGYSLEAADPDLQLVRLPEPAPGLLLALGLWMAARQRSPARARIRST